MGDYRYEILKGVGICRLKIWTPGNILIYYTGSKIFPHNSQSYGVTDYTSTKWGAKMVAKRIVKRHKRQGFDNPNDLKIVDSGRLR